MSPERRSSAGTQYTGLQNTGPQKGLQAFHAAALGCRLGQLSERQNDDPVREHYRSDLVVHNIDHRRFECLMLLCDFMAHFAPRSAASRFEGGSGGGDEGRLHHKSKPLAYSDFPIRCCSVCRTYVSHLAGQCNLIVTSNEGGPLIGLTEDCYQLIPNIDYKMYIIHLINYLRQVLIYRENAFMIATEPDCSRSLANELDSQLGLPARP